MGPDQAGPKKEEILQLIVKLDLTNLRSDPPELSSWWAGLAYLTHLKINLLVFCNIF